VSSTDRLSVLKLLAEDPTATLEECAGVVRTGTDPVGVVLAMAHAGEIAFASGQAITPFSAVHVRRTA
jgi:hypothetical protein